MSLIRLIQNLSLDENLSNLPEIIYDQNHRYEKLNLKKNLINNIIQQQTISVSMELSIEQRYNSLAHQFNLSSLFIEKQYQLALKNRIEIPPTLMRRILIDAIEILRLIIHQFNEDQEKLSRIFKHLTELENYHQLFDQYS